MNIFKSVFYLIKGLMTVGVNIFKPAVTLKYPEQKKQHTKLRGKISFGYNEDGSQKCIGCSMCQNVCPVFGAINIKKSLDSNGKQYLKEFFVNLDRCISCGNCVENCPTKAIVMTKEYELATSDKKEFKIYMRCQNGNIK